MSESVERWLSRLNSEKSKQDYSWAFQRFSKWKAEHGGKFADFTPDELIQYQQTSDNGTRYDLEELLQKYIRSKEGLRYKTKRVYYQTLRSFYMHNRAALPKDGGFKIKGDLPKAPSILNPDHIKKIALASKPCYTAIVLCMLGGAMGLAEFEYWNTHGWASLRQQLTGETDVVKVDLPGRKSNRNINDYYTLIGGDALRALRGYLGDDLDPSRPAIFLNIYGDPVKTPGLAMYWRRIIERLGIIKPVKVEGRKKGEGGGTRYGAGIHNLRDNFRTLWSRSGANPDIGEYLMGHKIDDLEYNQIYRDVEYAKQEYRRALPSLNILSGTLNLQENQELQNLKKELADLKQTIYESGLTPTIDRQGQITKLDDLGLSDGALEDLIRIIRKDRETKQE